MLGTRSPVRPLAVSDRDAALELCARRPDHHVFVAARLIEAARTGSMHGALGYREDGRLVSVCWASANVSPVELTPPAAVAYADRIRRWRSRSASVLGPRQDVEVLWDELSPNWGPPRTRRTHQPVMTATLPPSAYGIDPDPRVRPARRDEVDAVLPAAAHMFTAEIGYPPYTSNPRAYRASLAELIARGHTYVAVEHGQVIFKADIGSLALGHAQLQGVWLAPSLRGQGLAVPLLAAVVEQIMIGIAPVVTLYVNDFNAAARATYERLGFRTTGEFSTILL